LESFASVGYPHASNAIRSGNTVLDIGSGFGTDVLFASLKTGPKGSVIGLDITDAMTPITIEFAMNAALIAADGGRFGVVSTTIKRYEDIVAPAASSPFATDFLALWLRRCDLNTEN